MVNGDRNQGPQTVGGQTLRSGEQVLVTPGGRPVATTTPAIERAGSQRVAPTSPTQRSQIEASKLRELAQFAKKARDAILRSPLDFVRRGLSRNQIIQKTRELRQQRRDLDKRLTEAISFNKKEIKAGTIEDLQRLPRLQQLFEFRKSRGEPEITAGIGALADLGGEKFSTFIGPRVARIPGQIEVRPTRIEQRRTIIDRPSIADVKFEGIKTTVGGVLAKPIETTFIGDLSLFTIFGPLFETAVAAKAVKGKKVVKQTEKKASTGKSLKDIRDAFKRATDEELRDGVKEAIKQIDASDLTTAQKSLLKERLQAILLEAKTGTKILTEAGATDLRALQTALAKVRTPAERRLTFELFLPKRVPKLKGAGQIAEAVTQAKDFPAIVQPGGRKKGAFAGLGQFERTNEVAIGLRLLGAGVAFNKVVKDVAAQTGVPQLEVERGLLSNQQRLLKDQGQRQGLSELQINLQKTLQRQLLKQGTSQKQVQRQLQEQAIKLSQGLAVAQVSAVAQKLQQRQTTPIRTAGRLRTRGRFRIPPILLRTRGVPKRIRVRTLVTGRIPKFDVFTRKKGKFLLINKKPLKRTSALDFGASHVARTLRASFFIQPSTRKGLGKVKSGIKGFLNKNANQFRPAKSKALKGALVEKRKFRLDSSRERRKIQEARKMKRIPAKKLKSTGGLKKKR